MINPPNFDCLIVGGGIIGMLTARELHLSGMSVALLERGAAGHEATWAGGGIISPLYPWRYSEAVSQLARWGQASYPHLTEALKQESGIDPEYIKSGLLILDMNEADQAISWTQEQGMVLQRLKQQEILSIEPALGTATEEALWLPEVAQVRNPRLAASAKQSLINLGIPLLEHTEVTGFRQQKHRVTGVSTSKGDFSAEKIVVAGGAWTHQLLTFFGMDVDVHPVRGQMILFHATPELVRRIVLSKDRYVIPRKDGRILVGSTLEEVGFDKSTTDSALQELRHEAARIIPDLANIPVEHHWAGLRPGSTDGIPYICNHPQIDGVYINAGHYRNGVVLGPASARLMADIVLQRTPIVDSTFYHIEK